MARTKQYAEAIFQTDEKEPLQVTEKNKQLKRISTIDPPTDFLEGNTGDIFQLDGTTGEEIVLVLSQNKIIRKVFPRMITPPQTPQTGVLLEILAREKDGSSSVKESSFPYSERLPFTSSRRDTLMLNTRSAELVGRHFNFLRGRGLQPMIPC